MAVPRGSVFLFEAHLAMRPTVASGRVAIGCLVIRGTDFLNLRTGGFVYFLTVRIQYIFRGCVLLGGIIIGIKPVGVTSAATAARTLGRRTPG